MKPRAFHQWETFFNSPDRHFQTLYGAAPALLTDHQQAFQELLRHFKSSFPVSTEVFLLRIPARINLKGVHVEHRGGFMNTLTIAKEMLLAVAPRRDSLIRGANINPIYPDFVFDIAAEFPPGRQVDWLEYINQVCIEKGRWENYIKAVSYYLQNRFEQPLNGMDMAVSGQIPPAAGLSSSSALVVGTIQALNYINQLQLNPAEMTLMCGEAEWFVGTRGGAGDHASIIFGRRNYITHLQFFPLKVELIPMPPGLTVVACQSQVEAKKSAGARDIFNARVTTYEIALRLFKKYFPAFKATAHLR
ncbi:hypothetical protein L0128_22545, partial [candidate division KSB1 bacterium]|nr:hypothetical protein [candidate division KSB1 bacterium]